MNANEFARNLDVRGNSHGMLAIIYSIDEDKQTDYLHWVTREHTLERVSVPGFQRARLFRHIDPSRQEFLTLYSLDHAAVVASPEYIERLNNPTPWSTRIMPLMQGMTRGGGSIVQAALDGEGAFVAVIRLDQSRVNALNGEAGAILAREIAGLDRIASVRILAVDPEATGIPTNEKSIRGKDMSFDGLLIIEGLDASSVLEAAQRVKKPVEAETDPVDVYSSVFSRTKPKMIAN